MVAPSERARTVHKAPAIPLVLSPEETIMKTFKSPTTSQIARVLITSSGLPTVELPETVAYDFGVTPRSVENALRRLEDAGMITWHRKGRFGARRPFWPVTVHADHAGWAEVRFDAAVEVTS
jgi:DNA-binding transcriptional ArsR family regulator